MAGIPRDESERISSGLIFKLSLNCHGGMREKNSSIERHMLEDSESILRQAGFSLDQIGAYNSYFREKLRKLESSNSTGQQSKSEKTFLCKSIFNIPGECSLLIDEISLLHLNHYVKYKLNQKEFDGNLFKAFLQRNNIPLIPAKAFSGHVFSGSLFLQVLFEKLSNDDYEEILGFLGVSFLTSYKKRYNVDVNKLFSRASPSETSTQFFFDRANFQKELLREISIYFAGTTSLMYPKNSADLTMFDEVFKQQKSLFQLSQMTQKQAYSHQPGHNLFYQVQNLEDKFRSQDYLLDMYDDRSFFPIDKNGEFVVDDTWIQSNVFGTRLGLLGSFYDESQRKPMSSTASNVVSASASTVPTTIFGSITSFFSRPSVPQTTLVVPQHVLSEPEKIFSLLDQTSETRILLESHIKSLYPIYPGTYAGNNSIESANIILISKILARFDKEFEKKKQWDKTRSAHHLIHEDIFLSDIFRLLILSEVKIDLDYSFCLFFHKHMLTRSLAPVEVEQSQPLEPPLEPPPKRVKLVKTGGKRTKKKVRKPKKKNRRKTK